MESAMKFSSATLPVTSIEAYVHYVNAIPMINAEEEHELAVQFKEQQDVEAARRLVMAHLRFVVHVARGYDGYGLSQADLIQEGNVGLMKAVKRFDPQMGVRLVTFAIHWVKAEINEFVLKNWRIVKVATTKAQRKLFFNLRSLKTRLGWFNNQEVQAVAHELNVTPAQVREMEQRLHANDAAFDGYADDDNENLALAPMDYLADEHMTPAQSFESNDTEEHALNGLHVALEQLDPRSRAIVEARWLREEGHKATLHDLAIEHGVSAERIRQLEQKAMTRLKSYLTTTTQDA